MSCRVTLTRTGDFLSMGLMTNFLSLKEMFRISHQGKPIFGVSLRTQRAHFQPSRGEHRKIDLLLLSLFHSKPFADIWAFVWLSFKMLISSLKSPKDLQFPHRTFSKHARTTWQRLHSNHHLSDMRMDFHFWGFSLVKILITIKDFYDFSEILIIFHNFLKHFLTHVWQRGKLFTAENQNILNRNVASHYLG